MTDDEPNESDFDILAALLDAASNQNISDEEKDELAETFEEFSEMTADQLEGTDGETTESVEGSLDDTISIPNASEWVDEPPGETKLYLDRDQPRDGYQATAREVTDVILELNPREAVAINALGVADVLRDVDANAVDTLSNKSGLTVTETKLYGKTEATPEILDALLALYSGGLFTLTVYGADGTAIVARRDGTMLWGWLPESAYSKLTRQLETETLAALERI